MTLSILGPGPVDNELKSRPGGADSIMRLRSGPVKLRAPGEPVPDHDRLISHDCCREPAAFIVDSSHAPDGAHPVCLASWRPHPRLGQARRVAS